MKVLIVKMSSMGDMIHTLPALTDAQKAIPGISFDWVAEENFLEITSWHPAVASIIPIALRRWRKRLLNPSNIQEIKTFWRTLRAEHYDYIIDAQGLLKSAIIARAAHGIRYGFNMKSAREPLASCFYQHKLAVAKNLHAVTRIRQLFAQALGYSIPTDFPDYGIMKEKFCPSANSATENYLLFLHGTSRENKCWAEKNWIELAKLAKTAGLKVKLPWGNKLEFERASNIAAKCDNAEVLPKSTITEIGTLLLNAKGAVAVDTGFCHLAAALDVPTISLYGPTNPELIGAFGKNQIHLSAMETVNAQMVWREILKITASIAEIASL